MSRPRKTVLAIRQIDFQDLGVLHEPLIDAGYEIRYLDAFAEDPRGVEPTKPDLVVVLGGPYGVDERGARPFIEAEIDLLRTRLGARRPTFGICLGAQLMASALDAAVRSGVKEIGWKPVTLDEAGARGPLAEFADLPVLHWHGDTFDIPETAVRLASTSLCRNQAFALGPRIIAAQFHLEVHPQGGMDTWIACHADELRREGVDADSLVGAAAAAARTDRRRVPAMFARWLAQLD